jgi:hypothetical protein
MIAVVNYFFRPCRGSFVLVRVIPWLTPWATFYRRYAACILLRALVGNGFQTED